ncbi:extracellular solute-binding protein [Phycicoccus sonneratiae]|uniref:Extracellular solute-binding protein n=1 Tax=Phycicoccus sonneratiae TaxID=2807628 RepID=A0ABS2CQP9_9MICO|nr:extracellular solute-binding protein [Phycicoccus sonneraticus]MBM6402212.1 extracellular solute-binding protein [Phycicoccus sonneraticus]
MTRPSVVARLALCGLATSALLSGCVGAKEAGDAADPSANADAKDVTLVVSANDVKGGKNAAEAAWIEDEVIPAFVAQQKAKGVTAKVTFNGAGVEDEQYKTKLELNLRTGSGSDVFAADGIWLGELAAAGYVKPLDDVVGDAAKDWDGWDQISEAVQANLSFKDQRYGIPNGTDGRVLYVNKTLFAKAGLPADWQPTSWDEVLDAARALKKLDGVTPLQVNAGVPMGEATTAQGFLPLLAGTGAPLYDEAKGTWQGATPGVTDVLDFYRQVYGEGLGDPRMQQDKAGRDQSFAEFAQNKIGILAEGDYFWRSVICPSEEDCGATSMKNRDEVVGWAKIPAKQPGTGVGGQDFVSVSGGAGWMLSPKTKYPQQAWELMALMSSKEMQEKLSEAQIRVSARADVNAETLENDPLLSFISEQVLPITTYRPSDEAYNEVSLAIQQATADVVSGKSPQEAAATYAKSLTEAVGAEHVAGG